MSMPAWFVKNHESRVTNNCNSTLNNRATAFDDLQNLLGNGCTETGFNRRLKKEPDLFHHWYRTGHLNYAWPEVRLGSEYVMDWLIMTGDSSGGLYTAFELENPQATPFTQQGSFSDATRKGIDQIFDWRNWLQQNLNYAVSSTGSGLYDINPRVSAVVVVGQNSRYRDCKGFDKYQQKRKSLKTDSDIEVISYENFLLRLKESLSKPPSIESLYASVKDLKK